MNRKVLASLTLALMAMAVVGIWGCSSSYGTEDVPVEVKTPTVGTVGNSGCMSEARSMSSTRSTSPWDKVIVMKKEGDAIFCELKGFNANCAVDSFDVQSEFAKGKNAPDSLFINVSSVVSAEADCTCPYTVYFNIRDVKADSIYLSCWLYSGVVSFKDSSEVKVEVSRESVTLDDGSRYYLYKPCMQAMLYSVNVEDKDEYQIPSAITYNGEEYSVVSFYHGSIYSKDIKKLVFPKSIQRIDEDNADFKNGIFAPKLENIEVEPGSRLMSSVDGVLYDAKHKSLWCCPVASDRTEYTVIDGVEKICQYAFYNCSNLKSIRLPESVTIIKTCAFAGCKNLESIYVMGKLNRNVNHFEAFLYMESTPTLYVPESEVEFIKKIYKGPVQALQ